MSHGSAGRVELEIAFRRGPNQDSARVGYETTVYELHLIAATGIGSVSSR